MDFFDKKSLLKDKINFAGIKEITDENLLAIILGKGKYSDVACNKSIDLMNKVHQIENLTGEYISKIEAISQGDRRFLEAITEFATRIKQYAVEEPEIISTNIDIEKIFRPLISTLPYEELWIVCLTSANRVIDKFMISKGSDHSSVFDIKLLMRKIIDNLSASVIMVHNHPNGDVLPSEDDIVTTLKVKSAMAYFDIVLLDHVILSNDKSYSFVENKNI